MMNRTFWQYDLKVCIKQCGSFHLHFIKNSICIGNFKSPDLVPDGLETSFAIKEIH